MHIWEIRVQYPASSPKSKIQIHYPIVYSDPSGVKLLGVPALQHKTDEKSGKKIATATMNQLTDWNCEESVKAMVYSKNTYKLLKTVETDCQTKEKGSMILKSGGLS